MHPSRKLIESIPFIVVFGLLALFYFQEELIIENYFSPNARPGIILLGTGTGFFVNNQHVVTNEHVIRSCRKLTIEEPKSLRSSLTLIAEDSANDLAVLRAETAQPENVARIGKESTISRGDLVTIIGYPGDHYKNLQARVVEPIRQEAVLLDNKERFIERKLIISDSVRPGNSGGPVLNQQGNVIGVVEAYMVSQNAETHNIEQIYGAAVSVKRLKEFLDQYQIPYFPPVYEQGGLEHDALESYGNHFIVKIRCVR